MRKNRYKLNILGRCTVFILVFLLITGWLPGAPVFAQTLSAGIPYEQSWSADPNRSGLNKTFEYRITAENGSPLPEGSSGYYSLTLTGNAKGTEYLNIPFSKPGYYDYRVTPQRTGKKGGYICDDTVYKLMIMVVNSEDGLTVGAITIRDEKQARLQGDKQAKRESLKYKQRYYVPSSGGGDDPGGGTNRTGGNVTPAPDGTGLPVTEDGPGIDTFGLDDGDIPTTEGILDPDIDHWALLNLILLILTIIISIVDIILYFRNKDDDEEEEDGEDEERWKRKKLILRIATIIPACLALIMFILTEDMRLPMQIVDEWTLWMLIFFIAAAVLALLSRSKQNEETESG